MSCSKPNCRVTSDKDPMINCWLCNTVYHAKCVELTARTADNLREDKGLRWCCSKCKVYDIQFYSFFKNTRKELEDISQDLLILTEKFRKHKNVFDNPSNLNTWLDSPSKSPKRKKMSPKSKKKNSLSEANGINNSDSSSSTSSNDPPNVPSINIVHNSSNNIPTNSIFTEIVPENIPSTNILTPFNMMPSGSNIFYSPINSPSNNGSMDNSPIPSSGPNQLKVISSKKTIFAARFAAETTEDDILFYITSRLRMDIDTDINIFKFKYTEKRSKSSFKIILPEEVFAIVVNPDFWPPKAIIREYIYKENASSNVVQLPPRTVELSKN